MRDLREVMQGETDEVSKLAHQIKTRLEALDKSNAAALKKKVQQLPAYWENCTAQQLMDASVQYIMLLQTSALSREYLHHQL